MENDELNNVQNSKIMSYIIRWMMVYMGKFLKKRNYKIKILTDKYIEFIPQLNIGCIAPNSILCVPNNFSYYLAVKKIETAVKGKKIICENKADIEAMLPTLFFTDTNISIEQMRRFSGLTGIIFPASDIEQVRRLIAECKYSGGPSTLSIEVSKGRGGDTPMPIEVSKGIGVPPHVPIIRLDDLYFGQDETFGDSAHHVVKSKMGRALSVKEFEFLSRWACVIFSTRLNKIPNKMPKEIKGKD
jgi:hypothetical protein